MVTVSLRAVVVLDDVVTCVVELEEPLELELEVELEEDVWPGLKVRKYAPAPATTSTRMRIPTIAVCEIARVRPPRGSVMPKRGAQSQLAII
jgi:hypothetical protein